MAFDGIWVEQIEVVLLLLLVEASDRKFGIGQDALQTAQTDFVFVDDEHVIGTRLFIRRKHPNIFSSQYVVISDNEVVSSIDVVSVSNHYIVVGKASFYLIDRALNSQRSVVDRHFADARALPIQVIRQSETQYPKSSVYVRFAAVTDKVVIEDIAQGSDVGVGIAHELGVDIQPLQVISVAEGLYLSRCCDDEQKKQRKLSYHQMEDLYQYGIVRFAFHQNFVPLALRIYFSFVRFSPISSDYSRIQLRPACNQISYILKMTTWLGDKYEGEYKQGWYHGYGKLHMDSGIVYEGQFVKGHFHGEGRLIYPNGGYYKAQWEEGKMINGEYIFNDNLNFEKDNWKHCVNDDRRFYQEYLHGIKPSGATQQTREDKPHHIPTGTYDTGDGYYEPVKSIIYTYDGKIYRTPTQQEVKFIVAKCRYVSKAVDIDGSKDRVIKKVLEIQTKK